MKLVTEKFQGFVWISNGHTKISRYVISLESDIGGIYVCETSLQYVLKIIDGTLLSPLHGATSILDSFSGIIS